MNPLRHGLKYRAFGWCVIPVKFRQKTPLIPWKTFQTRCSSEAEIQTWLRQFPQANIGIVTGEVSNLVVLDVDGEEGEQTLKKYTIPPTRAVKTARGVQYYFQHPGYLVHNFARKMPGLDLRGDGGFVVAPPSVHPSGHVYAWLNEGEIAPLPDWLVELTRPKPEPRPVEIPQIHQTPWAIVQQELERLATAPEGCRNNMLNVVAFRLGKLVARGMLNRFAVEDILTSVAVSRGLTPYEVKNTIRSGLEAGMQGGLH